VKKKYKYTSLKLKQNHLTKAIDSTLPMIIIDEKIIFLCPVLKVYINVLVVWLQAAVWGQDVLRSRRDPQDV